MLKFNSLLLGTENPEPLVAFYTKRRPKVHGSVRGDICIPVHAIMCAWDMASSRTS